jgi:hypothetical protein
MAAEDKSPLVRLYLASALQRIEPQQRWAIAEKLIAHGEDVEDQNLPLMYWYAVEPLVPLDTRRALAMAARSKVPVVREYVTRRIASKPTAQKLEEKK